jgi:hypothetical protein
VFPTAPENEKPWHFLEVLTVLDLCFILRFSDWYRPAGKLPEAGTPPPVKTGYGYVTIMSHFVQLPFSLIINHYPPTGTSVKSFFKRVSNT